MKKIYLSALITMLVIGFAAVATNLAINGTINFGFNQKDFDEGVIFTYTNTMHGDATINDDKKTITFNTIKLEDVNQEAILDFDVTNKSNQYDASVTIECGLETASELYEQYIKIEQDLTSPFDLNSGDTRKGRLTITLIKAYDDGLEQEINMACELIATPKERTSEGNYTPVEHQYEEILLHGADPVLDNTTEAMSIAATTNKELIPVLIDNSGNVTRADTTKQWYDYETKQWANAVILNDGVEEPEVGSEIDDENIESYFVWIPKYRYKLWNVDGDNEVGPFPIEIEFGTEDTTDVEGKSCATPLNQNKTQASSGQKGNCSNGEWMTHPAFITMGVNGFWVGKFEVGYKDANSKEEAEIEEGDSTKVIVKPDEYSWRNITNKNMFNTLKGYATNLDSHMMKNTEWGAVAYLSHSKYGINNEVAKNTEPNYKTGYAKTNDSIVPYPSQSGFIASTTGNITGIYDMSGGAWERMAAYLDVASTILPTIGSSGFTKTDVTNIGEKYFDVYDKDNKINSYEKRILGDATGEMGPFNDSKGSWYQEYADFVESLNPWFQRGSYSNDILGIEGQFVFDKGLGGKLVNSGSRLVLSPKE